MDATISLNDDGAVTGTASDDDRAPGHFAIITLAPHTDGWRTIHYAIGHDLHSANLRDEPLDITDGVAHLFRPSVVRRAVFAAYELSRSPGVSAVGEHLHSDRAAELHRQMEAAPPPTQARRGRPRTPDDELRAVAEMAIALAVEGRKGAIYEQVAEALPAPYRGLTADNVRDRIKQARDRGWLAPANGRRGEYVRGPLLGLASNNEPEGGNQ